MATRKIDLLITGVLLIFLTCSLVAVVTATRVSIPEVVRCGFTFNITEHGFFSPATAPFTIYFRDCSEGSPTRWNWSFGDGTFSEEQHPEHTYTKGSKFVIILNVSNDFTFDTQTDTVDFERYAKKAYDADVEFTRMPHDLVPGGAYHVRMTVRNTGSHTWYGDPANSDYVYLSGVGGTTGDAAKFNLTQIPMLSVHERVEPGEFYDFSSPMQAPGTPGTYVPALRMYSASSGGFGDFGNVSTNVIENPLPVNGPDGGDWPRQPEIRDEPFGEIYKFFRAIRSDFSRPP